MLVVSSKSYDVIKKNTMRVIMMIMFVYFLHMYAYTYTYKIHPSESVDKNEISTYKCNMVTVSSSRVIS